MKRFISFIFLIAVCFVACTNETDDNNDSSAKVIYKAISLDYGNVQRGQYIAYAYDDSTYLIKDKSDKTIANGSYSIIEGSYCIELNIKEYTYFDFTNNILVTKDKEFTAPMKNNDTEFFYYCGNGDVIHFELEAFYNLRYK